MFLRFTPPGMIPTKLVIGRVSIVLAVVALGFRVAMLGYSDGHAPFSPSGVR